MKYSYKNIFILILGFFWIYIYIYNFFLRTRVVLDIKPHLNYYLAFVYVIIIISYSIFLIISILQIYNYKIRPNVFTQKILQIIDLYYWRPLNYIYFNYFKNIPKIGIILDKLGFLIIKLSTILGSHRNLILIFDCIPRTVLTIILFIDIVIYAKISFSIIFVSILGPLVFFFYLSLILLRDFSKANLTFYESIITPEFLENNQVVFKSNANITENAINNINNEPYFIESLEQISILWLEYDNLYRHIQSLLYIRTYLYKYLYIVLYIVFIAIWCKFLSCSLYI